MKFDFDTQKFIRKMGMQQKGQLQKLVDNEFIRLCDPYVPFDAAGKYATPGRLRDSAVQNTVIGSGLVVYNTPYARYLYYHPEFHFQGAPNRGAYWVDRAMQDGGLKTLQNEITAYCRKRSK